MKKILISILLSFGLTNIVNAGVHGDYVCDKGDETEILLCWAIGGTPAMIECVKDLCIYAPSGGSCEAPVCGG